MFQRLSRRLDKFSGEYEVALESWHGRAYTYWQQHYGEFKTRDYQERFCHFWRVVVIWLPLNWLAFTKVWRIPIWPIPLVVAAGLDFALLPPYAAIIIAYVCALSTLITLAAIPDAIRDRVKTRWLKISAPLEPAYRVVIVPLWNHGLALAGKWFFRKRFGPGIYPASLAGVGFVTWLFVAHTRAMLTLLAYIGAGLAALGLFALLVYAVFCAVRYLRSAVRPRGYRRPSQHHLRATAGLVTRYAVTKKRRVCPPIKFVHREQ